MSRLPSGWNPRPDGACPGSRSVVMSPCRFTVCTASPSMSENHNSPSNHRGPSPKPKPPASFVSSTAPLQITRQVSRSQGVTVNQVLVMKKFYGHTLLYLHETISLGA